MEGEKKSFIVGEREIAQRLDKILVLHFPKSTRHFLQKLIKEGQVLVNGKTAKAGLTLQEGQKVEIFFPPLIELRLKAAKIPLDIVFENKDLLVINKPAGLVTHPGAGQSYLEDSLVNAILHHCKGELSGISGVMRPGIVHRLDKDTSGLIIVAKNDLAHQDLAAQMKERSIEKSYVALLAGHLEPRRGSIDAPIGRSSADRKKMAVVAESRGRKALTHYEILEYFKKKPLRQGALPEAHYSYVAVRLVTGRTHQIRIHFASIGFPVVGDPLYGREKLNKFFDQNLGFRRQFLHAHRIEFRLPGTKKRVALEAALPKDLATVLEWIKGDF